VCPDQSAVIDRFEVRHRLSSSVSNYRKTSALVWVM
jgi:hypothetical protein